MIALAVWMLQIKGFHASPKQLLNLRKGKHRLLRITLVFVMVLIDDIRKEKLLCTPVVLVLPITGTTVSFYATMYTSLLMYVKSRRIMFTLVVNSWERTMWSPRWSECSKKGFLTSPNQLCGNHAYCMYYIFFTNNHFINFYLFLSLNLDNFAMSFLIWYERLWCTFSVHVDLV